MKHIITLAILCLVTCMSLNAQVITSVESGDRTGIVTSMETGDTTGIVTSLEKGQKCPEFRIINTDRGFILSTPATCEKQAKKEESDRARIAAALQLLQILSEPATYQNRKPLK